MKEYCTSFSWRLHRSPVFWLPLLPFTLPLHLGQDEVRVREGTSISGKDWEEGKGAGEDGEERAKVKKEEQSLRIYCFRPVTFSFDTKVHNLSATMMFQFPQSVASRCKVMLASCSLSDRYSRSTKGNRGCTAQYKGCAAGSRNKKPTIYLVRPNGKCSTMNKTNNSLQLLVQGYSVLHVFGLAIKSLLYTSNDWLTTDATDLAGATDSRVRLL